MKQLKLLVIGDTPTRETGFGRVIRNLTGEWIKLGVFREIHLWGIGYWGHPYDYPPNVRIYPAATPVETRWEHLDNLKRLAVHMETGGFTHIWILQDVWGLAPLSKLLIRLAKDRGIKTLLYFPVDAPLDPYWTEIIGAVGMPVAYCQYGRVEAAKALALPRDDDEPGDFDRRLAAAERLRTIPHGADPLFRKQGGGDVPAVRRQITSEEITPDDLLLLSVAVNQRRKGLAQTVQTWAELRARMPDRRVFLYLHSEAVNHTEGVSLPMVAEQLGLGAEIGKTLFFGHQSYFMHGRPVATDAQMNLIYNAADWLLSTSLGEGWGLPLTEAMGAGLPVAAPNHTACRELLGEGARGLCLPLVGQADMVIGDNSRLRHRVSAAHAAMMIESEIANPAAPSTVEAARKWVRSPEMQWPFIARQWLKLMEVM